MRIIRTLYTLILHKLIDGWILSLLLLTLAITLSNVLEQFHRKKESTNRLDAKIFELTDEKDRLLPKTWKSIA